MAVPGLDTRYQCRCEDAGYIGSFRLGKELSLIVAVAPTLSGTVSFDI